jgi:hypothetical protein
MRLAGRSAGATPLAYPVGMRRGKEMMNWYTATQ